MVKSGVKKAAGGAESVCKDEDCDLAEATVDHGLGPAESRRDLVLLLIILQASHIGNRISIRGISISRPTNQLRRGVL